MCGNGQSRLAGVLTVAIAIYLCLRSMAMGEKIEVVFPSNSPVIPARIGDPVTYSYKHRAWCSYHGHQGPGAGSKSSTLAAVNGHSVYTQYCDAGYSQSEWGFGAVNNPDGKTVTLAHGLPAGQTPSYFMSAEAETPYHLKIGVSAAYTETSLKIRNTTMVPVEADESFAHSASLLTLPVAYIIEDWAEEQVSIDDFATYSRVWTMGADDYDPFEIMRFNISLYVLDTGSSAKISQAGIELNSTNARISTEYYAMNHQAFSGEASLVDGVFSSSGCLAGLPWVLTYAAGDPDYVQTAFLAAEDAPSAETTFVGADVGDEDFWNSNPWFETEDGLAIQDNRSFVPQPTTLVGLISMGLMGALGFWRRRRRAA